MSLRGSVLTAANRSDYHHRQQRCLNMPHQFVPSDVYCYRCSWSITTGGCFAFGGGRGGGRETRQPRHFLSNDLARLSVFPSFGPGRRKWPNWRDARDSRDKLSSLQRGDVIWRTQGWSDIIGPRVLGPVGWSVELRLSSASLDALAWGLLFRAKKTILCFQMYHFLLTDSKLRHALNLGSHCGIVTFLTWVMVLIILVCSLAVSRAPMF